MKINKNREEVQHQRLSCKHNNPVVIGGIGGSGTRLIALCLKEAGYFMGTDLGKAEDNLWFTLLFKRIEILSCSAAEFDELLDIMLNGMSGAAEFTRDQTELIDTLASKAREQHPASWLRQRTQTLLSKKPEFKLGVNWGWKEPNSHIVLDHLVDRLENMKYIHVARNGLDMAYSDNQNQLKLWGACFINEPFKITPYYSLKYWCMVHQRMLDIGNSMHQNFLFLNYDDFCLNPDAGIKQLCEFLELEADHLMPQLEKLIVPPNSIGRFKKHGANVFAKNDVEYVKSLGFDVSRC